MKVYVIDTPLIILVITLFVAGIIVVKADIK